MFAIHRIAEIAGGFVVRFLGNVSLRSVNVGIIVLGMMFAAAFVADTISIWFVMAAGYFLYAIIRTLVTARIQNALPSARRAMILSLFDMINQVSIIAFYGLITVGAVMHGYRIGYLLCGGFIMMTGIIALIFLRNIKHK
ncbi:MAG: hypothetical protein LBK26_01855 [Rickettsiales bacterium]|jgi:hypothetical protein|nr:hypothetical protein [Rickettsiales bacterium]